MKFLEHKGFIQKTIIAILCVTLFNFIAPNYMCLVSNAASAGAGNIPSNGNSNSGIPGAGNIPSNGNDNSGTPGAGNIPSNGNDNSGTPGAGNIPSNDGSDSSEEGSDTLSTEEDDFGGGFFKNLGGWLLDPIVELFSFLADTVASIMQTFMMGNSEAVMTPMVDNYAKTDVNDAEEADVRIYKKYNLLMTFFPNFTYSCEEIFANKVPMLDVNFLNPSVTNLGDEEVDENKNIAAQLQSIIKAWYRVLRMIAIVGLLSVLIYIGIRIMIDSNVDNKAKYKQRLLDWLVAFVILFSMQYIMSFTLSISEELTNLFAGKNEETRNIVVYYHSALPANQFFKTNLIGLVRFKIQNDNIVSKVAYLTIYFALIAYTVKFTFVYLKRVLHMAFLTIISPIIALMYPIDKIQDGKAQGFETWIKEYIFNALLQPFHYLLYTVLVTSSVSLAASNPIYAIAALWFMTQAEKFLKKIFGFDKANNGMVGGMSAFANGAIASRIVSTAKNGAILAKEYGPQLANELAKGTMPTTKKDTDIDSLPIPDDKPQNSSSEIEKEKEEVQRKMREQQEKEEQERQQREMEEQQRILQEQMQQQAQEHQEQMEEQQEQMEEQQKQMQEQMEQQAQEQQATIQDEGNAARAEQQQGTSSSQSSMQSGTNTPPINSGGQQNANAGNENTRENSNNSGSANNNQNRSQSRESINLASSIGNRRATPDKKAGRRKIANHFAKKIWDKDKSTADNLKRWGKRYVKAGMGLVTLAAYTGTTLTDGKITAAEEVAAFAAGVKGGGIAFDNADKTVGNYVNTYREGAYGVDEAATQQYQKQWKDNKEVKDFYHNNYADSDYGEEQYKNIASEELLTRGVKDLDEQKQCFKYADAVTKERYEEWEKNEKEVIRQEHQDYSDLEVENEFENRKKDQAQEIRKVLGKDGKKLNDDQAIHRAMMANATKEAAAVLKFRKRAAGKDALLSGKKKDAFIKQQVKELKAKPEHKGKSDKELESYVTSMYNRVDRYDALNKL